MLSPPTTAGTPDTLEDRGAPPAEATPAPDAKARFDVGDKEAATPARDLQDHLGGAKTEPRYEEKRRRPAGGKDDQTEPEGTTSRLLRAKRRAQDKRKDEPQP